MNTNYRELLGISTLVDACGITKENRNFHQKKAIHNISHCAGYEWEYVNDYYDNQSVDAREYILNAKELYKNIYSESQKNLYGLYAAHFYEGTEDEIKHIRFCGKNFLEKVCLYYTAKLIEEAFYEVDGTEDDAERIASELLEIKDSIQ